MIKPLHDNVLVEPLVEEKVSNKGIILSTNNDENQNTTKGKIVALADGFLYKENKQFNFDIKVGDIVYFKEYSGTTVVDDNKSYKMLTYDEIVGIKK
ncbi:GroES family chaperonin [[Mycoplasma] testudinis]|uniref:GroES family chaperonin n=1 Tax=[Mycoplasma] testudinis TaxID=33924 RepID=UPI00055ADE72|nr:molecular chaperone GroES [[Mycoplasma] testudinis]